MVGWCLELDGRQDRDECAKPTTGRASSLADGNVAVFSMVRFQKTEMRKALQKKPFWELCEGESLATCALNLF